MIVYKNHQMPPVSVTYYPLNNYSDPNVTYVVYGDSITFTYNLSEYIDVHYTIYSFNSEKGYDSVDIVKESGRTYVTINKIVSDISYQPYIFPW